MTLAFEGPVIVGMTIVILIAGTTNGLAGFGFALVGTMALATTINPATAVVFMIIPILAVNVSLVRDLSQEELRSCSRRFGPLITAALIGTVIGMVILNRIPTAPLRVGLGLLTLGFVATAQQRISIPEWSTGGTGTFARTQIGMLGVGGISGLLFGGTNVGIQLVAYLRSFQLSHGLFVGVVALVFLGVNGIRVIVAGLLGLYPNWGILFVSIVAAVPAVIGVAVGKRLRVTASERSRRLVVLGLLTIVGIRLVSGGLGLI
ncbi:sulfite exporter TauE/SafE family protein [Haloquadratum walsbyi]|uniref:Probable membrane transporter protein n=1 Tax=Haloquadratum walsbyi J07HQW2 TaxID=1238425 RepID=U1PL67_9EURY|nr:sulfite exporter TauE/SafE family protein [Haloquadratum walsbyi]ERG94432.1 MAG: sulfite exporter TauE/SafE [Haloquadratum walsbyi J07HQW2]